MYTRDWITATGIHIHLSMSDSDTCYIFVNDIYGNQLTMKYFTDIAGAVNFINNI